MFLKDTYSKDFIKFTLFDCHDEKKRGVIDKAAVIKACQAMQLPESKIEILILKWKDDEKFLIGRSEFCELLWPHVCPSSEDKNYLKKDEKLSNSGKEGNEGVEESKSTVAKNSKHAVAA